MQTLWIVDDDELSREILELLATKAGYTCTAVESGTAALERLAAGALPPEAVLADMQMPGITGTSLAKLLRSACGPAVPLIAMSGTAVTGSLLEGFDGFLLKPFTIADLSAMLAGVRQGASPASAPEAAAVLDRNTYNSLRQSMPPTQLRALYTMCLDDAERRLRTIETAAQTGDREAYIRAAHAIKGGCGMVGATELAALAAAMERDGPPPLTGPLENKAPFVDFLSALERLRRMLNALPQ